MSFGAGIGEPRPSARALISSRGDTLPSRSLAIKRSLHKSGEQIYVDMSFALVKDQAGEMLGSMAVARDATQRFLEEKNLRRQLAELTPKPAQ